MSDIKNENVTASLASPKPGINRERTRPVYPAISRSGNIRTQAPKGDPKAQRVGDVTVPWNVPETVFVFKAARDMVLTDITIDCKEVVSPSGAPVLIEAWMNGRHVGDHPVVSGTKTFDKTLPLKKLDTIELRLCVRGEAMMETAVKDLWFLYCVV